jgi:hypothetical protein
MHRILPAAVLLAAAVPAAAAEQRYTVTDFDRVEVSGPYQVTLSTGRPSSAVATGTRDSIDRVDIAVQGGVLRVRPNPSAWGGSGVTGPVTIALTTQSLRAATVNGSGSLDVDKVRSMQLDVAVIGSGRARIAGIAADNVRANLLGSGSLELGGTAKALRAELHGSGGLAAADLKVDDAAIVADSSGEAKLAVVRSAKVTSRGSGGVEIIGSPACTVDATGAGRVQCGK